MRRVARPHSLESRVHVARQLARIVVPDSPFLASSHSEYATCIAQPGAVEHARESTVPLAVARQDVWRAANRGPERGGENLPPVHAEEVAQQATQHGAVVEAKPQLAATVATEHPCTQRGSPRATVEQRQQGRVLYVRPLVHSEHASESGVIRRRRRDATPKIAEFPAVPHSEDVPSRALQR